MTNEVQDITGDDVADAGTVLPDKAGDKVAAYYNHMQELTTGADDVDVPEKVLQAILNATTVGDILRAGEAMAAEQVLDMPLRVTAIRASESGFVEGADYYLHVDAVLIGNGDAVTFSCGASDVCMKLIALDMRGMLPIACKLERAKKATKAGFFPLFLRALGPDETPF